MADDDKKALYRRVASANIHVVMERMRVHGFWPLPNLPPDPLDEASERKGIDAELRKLDATGAGDPTAIETALKAERMRRWEASKKRRIEQKKLKDIAKAERLASWTKEKAQKIVHLGRGVSAGLEGNKSDISRLRENGLPVLHTAADLAKGMGIPIGRLRFLTYHRDGATIVHYARFEMPKKSGGVRHISAPKRDLKGAQHWVLKNLLECVGVRDEAHGFVRARSVVTNATPHVGKNVVINLDLKDFFPSISFPRVRGLFRKLGYSDQVATCLALLCTEPPRANAQVDGKTYFVAVGERVLPQGAPTSPAITNLLCRSLDRRLAGLAKKRECAYTRYADDLTFSLAEPAKVGPLLGRVRSILGSESFVVHPDKTRVMHRGRRQEVTGVVVNDKATIARSEVRELRAILHNAARHGLASQNRDDHPNFAAHLKGRVAYVKMVDPHKAAKLEALLAPLIA